MDTQPSPENIGITSGIHQPKPGMTDKGCGFATTPNALTADLRPVIGHGTIW